MPVDQNLFKQLSLQFSFSIKQINNTVNLLDEGATVPFIARYRKEATLGLNEVDIEAIRLASILIRAFEKRKLYVIEVINTLGKLSPTLKVSIENCLDQNELEDIYLPFKVKRKTKATAARENGLESLASWLMKESYQEPSLEAKRYLNKVIKNESEAIQGARDIIAEWINEDIKARNTIRILFEKFAVIQSKIAKGKETEAYKYQDYFKYNEALNRCPSHRILAMFRGEEDGYLKLGIGPDEDIAIQKLEQIFIHRKTPSGSQIALACKDAYKRLLGPSIETEFRNLSKKKADKEAIAVFAENLRQLLLSAPLGSKRILAIDPGFKSGCKVVCLDEEGNLMEEGIIHPHEPQKEIAKAIEKVQHWVKKHQIQSIAIGNGTAGRETEDFIKSIRFEPIPDVFMVNENGASIYSASEIAREEFPDKDLTVRGAVSIGRRLSDPLAELVKIDPKSIGVGQYQHDVDQNELKQSLESVVLSCVNHIGVNLNTASKSLLMYVSGLGPQLAQNIVQYRKENGPFTSRRQLLKVTRLGEKAYEQSAGFLRIPNATHPLDNSAVHPESYDTVEKMAFDQKCTILDLLKNELLRNQIVAEKYVSASIGLPSIKDILKELAKPGLDPRATAKPFSFGQVKKPEDLTIGLILPGIVTNITKFGCFVDIGVKQDGMVHISQLANKYVSDPATVVSLQQQVQVKVIEIDLPRKRIGLSMKDLS
jgi:uncharacterized protein